MGPSSVLFEMLVIVRLLCCIMSSLPHLRDLMSLRKKKWGEDYYTTFYNCPKTWFSCFFHISRHYKNHQYGPLEPLHYCREEQKSPHLDFHWHSTDLLWVAHIRLWGQAKKRAMLPGSTWLLKPILHLEKILPLNTYSLWAETDANPACRQIPDPDVCLAQLLPGKLPAPLWVSGGRAAQECGIFLMGPIQGCWSASAVTLTCIWDEFMHTRKVKHSEYDAIFICDRTLHKPVLEWNADETCGYAWSKCPKGL